MNRISTLRAMVEFSIRFCGILSRYYVVDDTSSWVFEMMNVILSITDDDVAGCVRLDSSGVAGGRPLLRFTTPIV